MQSSNTPSNTLFVSNIGTYCIEPDIHDLFATFPGFVKFRRTQHPVQMQNGGHSFCAFVEYSVSNEKQTACHLMLQHNICTFNLRNQPAHYFYTNKLPCYSLATGQLDISFSDI